MKTVNILKMLIGIHTYLPSLNLKYQKEGTGPLSDCYI